MRGLSEQKMKKWWFWMFYDQFRPAAIVVEQPLCDPEMPSWILKDLTYSWIGPQVETHEKSIPGQTRRTTTISKPPLESSWQGDSKSAWSSFVKVILTFFRNNFPNNVRTSLDQADSDLPCWIYTLVQRSRALLRCLGSSGNWFFTYIRKSSWSACAR